MSRLSNVIADVIIERSRQDNLQKQGRFPWTCADIEVPDANKLAILTEEVGEVAREISESFVWPEDPERRERLRTELIQVAAVAVGWAEGLDEQMEQELAAVGLTEESAGVCDGCRREGDHFTLIPASAQFLCDECLQSQRAVAGKAVGK